MTKQRTIIKILLLVVIIISALQVVNASTPSNQVTQLFETELINGENELGELLILPGTYDSDIYNHSTFTQLTLQRYDKMTWRGTETITVTAPDSTTQIIVPNGQYYFSQTGLYQYESFTNSSLSSSIIAQAQDENRPELFTTYIPNGMNMTFSRNNFLVDGEEIVEVELSIEDDVEPDRYTINYSVGTTEKSYIFDLEENFVWGVDDISFNLNQSIKSGESKNLGQIEIENLGNVDNIIELNITGNQSEIIIAQEERKLYIESKVVFDFQLQVPSIVNPGQYDFILNFHDDEDNVEKLNLTVNVIDSTLPEIESINFSSNHAFTENTISVIANDNNEVINVTLEYSDRVIEMEKDANLFTTTQMFDKISQYVFLFCAYDETGNKACEQQVKQFIKITTVEGVNSSITLPSVMYGKYSQHFLFTLNETLDEPIAVELLDIESQVAGDDSYTVRLIDDKENIKRFDSYDNEIIIKEQGDYYLEIKSEEERTYEGLIRLHVPDYVEEVPDITFRVSFKNYDVPEDFTIDWFGTTVVCKVIDTGNLDTGYRECPIQIPLNVDKDDIALPTTVKEREQLDSDVKEQEEKTTKVRNRLSIFISLFIVIIIALVVLIYFRENVYPYTRRAKPTKDEEEQ